MADKADTPDKPTLYARLNGTTIRAKWPGKRWHGAYPNIHAAREAAMKDGLSKFVIDYVTEEH